MILRNLVQYSYFTNTETVLNVAEQCATHLYPTNIREILVRLANVEVDVEWRTEFLSRNSIPGLRIGKAPDGSPLAMNIDDVYPPGYTIDDLQQDIFCYRNLLSRVTGRLPKSFISSLT